MICVIDHKDTIITYEPGCLCLRRRGKKTHTIPVSQLEQVVVYGNPVVETAVWRNLAAAGVPVIMLALRGRPQTAMLGGGLAIRLPLRRMQHRLADNPLACLAMARWFIHKKIIGYTLPLATMRNEFALPPEEEEMFLSRLRVAEHHLDQSATVGEVMGVEGGLAQAWFRLLAGSLPNRFHFQGRNRRPPRDPVNSLLSLAYTLLLSEVRQAVLIEGYDPSLGFLHQEYPGREALTLDFQEIFRTGVDNFVLHWLAHAQLDTSSFYYRKEEGCRLAKATRPLFYQAWATYREEWPRYDSGDNRERHAPIREQLLGQTAEARQHMIRLEEKDDRQNAPS